MPPARAGRMPATHFLPGRSVSRAELEGFDRNVARPYRLVSWGWGL
jgi:hypothetical protein